MLLTAAGSGWSLGCMAGASVNNLSCSGGRSNLESVEKVVCPAWSRDVPGTLSAAAADALGHSFGAD